MKTIIIHSIRGLKNANTKLNTLSILKNEEWRIFQEEYSKIEKFIFQDNNRLLISINGITHFSEWDYITVNHNLRIIDANHSYMFKPIVCDSNIVMLNLDETDAYCFLLNNNSKEFKQFNMQEIQWYVYFHYKLELFDESQREHFKKRFENEKEKISKEQTIQQTWYPIAFFMILLFLLVLIANFFN